MDHSHLALLEFLIQLSSLPLLNRLIQLVKLGESAPGTLTIFDRYSLEGGTLVRRGVIKEYLLHLFFYSCHLYMFVLIFYNK